MNTTPRSLTIILTASLPVTIDGGLTVWSIERDHHGKGGKRLAIVARCLQSGEIIVLTDGREDSVLRALKTGLVAKPNTLVYKIFSKLIREGKATRVEPVGY